MRRAGKGTVFSIRARTVTASYLAHHTTVRLPFNKLTQRLGRGWQQGLCHSSSSSSRGTSAIRKSFRRQSEARKASNISVPMLPTWHAIRTRRTALTPRQSYSGLSTHISKNPNLRPGCKKTRVRRVASLWNVARAMDASDATYCYLSQKQPNTTTKGQPRLPSSTTIFFLTMDEDSCTLSCNSNPQGTVQAAALQSVTGYQNLATGSGSS